MDDFEDFTPLYAALGVEREATWSPQELRGGKKWNFMGGAWWEEREGMERENRVMCVQWIQSWVGPQCLTFPNNSRAVR